MSDYSWQRTGITDGLRDLERALFAAEVTSHVSQEVLHAVYASSLDPRGELALSAEEIDAATTDLASAVAAAKAMMLRDDWPVDSFRAHFRAVREFGADAAAKHHPAHLALGLRAAEQLTEFIELLTAACGSLRITVEPSSSHIELFRFQPYLSRDLPLMDVADWQRRGVSPQQAVDALIAADFDVVIAGAKLLDGGAPALDEGLL